MHLIVLTQTIICISRIIHLACLPPQIYLACLSFLFLLGIAVVLSHKLKITLTQNFVRQTRCIMKMCKWRMTLFSAVK